MCWQCRQVIFRTTEPITRAICALCKAAEDGIQLTPEALREYEATRAAAGGVPMLVIEEELPVVPGLKKFTLTALAEGAVRAVGFLRRKPDDTTQSAQLARAKRRTSLFEGMDVDPGAGLGTMTDMDHMLDKDPGQR